MIRTTLHIIDTTCPYNWINSEWQVIYPFLQDELVSNGVCNVNLITKDITVPNRDYIHYVRFNNLMLNEIFQQIKSIKSGDLVLFTDARTEIAFHVVEYMILNEIKVKIIGIWNDGIWNVNGLFYNAYKKLGRKEFGSKYEKQLANIYDYNLVTTEKHFKDFRSKISSRVQKINLPFEFLAKAYEDVEFVKAEDVVYNSRTNPYTQDLVKKLFKATQKDLEQYRFIDLCKFDNNFYRKAKYVLSNSMVFFNMQSLNLNPYDLYHSLCLGALPLTVESEVLTNMNLDICYNSIVIKPPFLNYIRNRDELQLRIIDYVENYQMHLHSLKKQFAPHYKKDTFLSTINEIIIGFK